MKRIGELLGESPGIVAVREKLARLFQLQSGTRPLPPILIQGETGTGKGLLARAIHRAGPRNAGPFVDVNCAAIPETLVEAEMFGFERGAFTDAKQAKAGLFQAAHGGTIFLDEVGLLPDAVQAKLLKVIEERTLRRLGSTRSEPVDAWIITATNEDLVAAARHRRFREDLYHRLAVLTLWLPPLRERGEDVLRLADSFLARACAEYDLPPRTLTPGARTALLAHPWPGNIRELANVIERVALLSEGLSVSADMLGLPASSSSRPLPRPAPVGPTAAPDDAGNDAEREHLVRALERTEGNISRAAVELGISRNTLRYRMEKHGLGKGPPSGSARRRAARPTTPASTAATAPPAADPPGPPTVRWERRRIALLRAVLASPRDATTPYASRAPEVLVEKVQTFGGRVEELSPVGIVASFGLDPIEDAPRQAAHAAMAVQKSAERTRDQGVDFDVKVAIHVGQFLVGESSGGAQIDRDAKRDAWAVLDALLASGIPDGILVSAAAAPFLERRFDLAPVGPSAERVGLAYRLAGRERRGFGRQGARFVGRRQELELLQSRLASVIAGHGQIAGVVGDVGIGKSRLISEFRQSVRHEPITYLEGHCLSYGASVPYLPVLEILRQSFGIMEAHGPNASAERVRAGLAAVGMEPDEWAPYLLLLLGVKGGAERLATLTPEAIKSRTLEAMRQFALKASRQRPVVLVLEDLHWIDKTSEECVAVMAEGLAGMPTLILATYRPGYRPGWLDKSYATQIALQPLSEEDSMTVVRSVLPGAPVPDLLTRLILDKAEGNPFFLEELSRAVTEQGDLRAIPAVPDTIHDVLVARIQRLPAAVRSLLQAASALGREFSAGLLRAVWDGTESVDAALAVLTSLEFLHPWSEAGESVYVFKHALTQEVAYETLMPDRRQAIHAAAGRALERAYDGRLQEVYDRLAHHYALAEEADKAVEYLTRFADKSARAHAHDEAVKALTEALSHAERVPMETRDRKRIEIVVRLPRSLTPLGRLAEIFSLLVGERDRVERLRDPALAAHYHYALGRAYMLGRRDQAVFHARRALAEAELSGDAVAVGRAYGLLAVIAALSGEVARGVEDGRRAVALLERTEDQASLCYAYWALGQCCARVGAFADALAAEASASRIAQAIGDQPQAAAAAWVTGVVHAAMGNWEDGIGECQRAVEMTRDALNRAIAAGWLGFAYVEHGDAVRAIAALEQSIPLLHQFGVRGLEGWFTAFLAEAHRLDGRLDRAEALSLEALHIATEADTRVAVGWAQQTRGRIALQRNDIEMAATSLGAALETFTAIDSRYECARIHVDLATIERERGRPEAAGRHLNEAHRLFTALGVPRYRERVENLAAEAQIPLRST